MNLLKAGGTIGGLTLVSRILGFAREMVFARVMGASAAAEYVYDGQAYRDIIRRAPLSPEARAARDRLDTAAGRRNRR